MPSGQYLMEEFFYAGGLPVVIKRLGEAGLLNKDALTVSGKTMWDEVKDAKKHADSLKADWSDFVGTTTTTGAKVDTPPTNTGSKIPWLDWEIVPNDDSVTIDVYMAGGGCTLPGKATVLMPGQGYEGVAEFVFDVITSRGVNACPPLLVGVGVSTSAETAARLSKKAILRPVDSRHPNDNAALMEELLAEGLNELGLGPQGLTGNNSVMGVNIESSARHPSTIGVAVSTGCWAHRRGKIRINADLTYDILSHEGVVL